MVTSAFAEAPMPESNESPSKGNGQSTRGAYIPNVAENLKPHVGLDFESEEAARSFYNTYAKAGGFSIRRNQLRALRSTGEVVWRRFVCSREGVWAKRRAYNETKSTVRGRPNRQSTRVACKASISIKKNSSDRWVVTKFLEGHTHELANGEESLFLRSHRMLDNRTRKLLKDCATVGIGPTKAFDVAVETLDEGKDTSFTRTDVRNEMYRSRKRVVGRDAEEMLEFLLKKQDKDPNTFVAIKKNEAGQLISLFWADGRSRADFMAFRDILCLDTTYRCNRYSMPFAPFVGLNHHKQTVVFGCGLVSDETVDSFEWLLRSFRDSVEGYTPSVIISDQDRAIEVAIKTIFPAARHRFCLWHILRKVPERLGRWYREHDDFQKNFTKVVYDNASPQDFEVNWRRFLATYGLRDHQWLAQVYTCRQKWVPVYYKSIRCYGMCTNQRSEGFHAFMDHYTGRLTSLYEFVNRFDMALARRRLDEVAANKQTREACLVRKTTWSMEKHAFHIYTSINFKNVQQEMWESGVYLVQCILEAEDRGVYEVINPEHARDTRLLQYSCLKNSGNCSCLMWESTGVVCRHLFALLKHLRIVEFPSYFILQRMTRDPRLGMAVLPANSVDPGMVTTDEVALCFRSVHHAVCGHHWLMRHALTAGQQLLRDVEEMKKWYNGSGVSVGMEGSVSSPAMSTCAAKMGGVEPLRNPPMAASRGRPKCRKKAPHPKQMS